MSSAEQPKSSCHLAQAAAEGTAVDASGLHGNATTETKENAKTEASAAEDEDVLRVENLKDLLVELNIPQFSSYEKTLPKLLYDPRFTSIPKLERRTVFASARRRMIEESTTRQLKNKNRALQRFQQFFERLVTSKKIGSDSTMHTLTQSVGKDPCWNDPALDVKQRDLYIRSRLDELRKTYQEQRLERRQAFTSMVENALEQYTRPGEPVSWSRLKERLRDDPRYYAIPHRLERHRLFSDLVSSFEQRHSKLESSTPSSREARKRQQNAVSSAPDQEHYKRRLEVERAQDTLRMLLAERVKNPFELSFTSARDAFLTADPRFNSVQQLLSDSEQYAVYLKFVDSLKRERLLLLETELSKTTIFENPDVTFEKASQILHWDTDKRFQGLPREDVHACFLRWHRKFLQECKDSFGTYLKTCAAITSHVPDHGPKFKELLAALSEDQRYKRLDGFPQIREEMVIACIRDLKNETSRLFI